MGRRHQYESETERNRAKAKRYYQRHKKDICKKRMERYWTQKAKDRKGSSVA